MKSNSSTEVANIACDVVVFATAAKVVICYGGEPIRPKTAKILRSNLVVSQNVYLELANNIWTFLRCLLSYFFNKKTKTLTF